MERADSAFSGNITSFTCRDLARIKHEAMSVGRAIVDRDRGRAPLARCDDHVSDGVSTPMATQRLRQAFACACGRTFCRRSGLHVVI